MNELVLTVLIGTAILGGVSGIVGSFAVLRRRALVGDLLSHAALPGICIAFFIADRREYSYLLVGAFVSGFIGVGLVTFISRWTRTKEDAAIGIVLSTFFGIGIVLLSIIQRQESAGGTSGLERYTLGQAANLTRDDVALIAVVSFVAAAIVLLLYKEFKILSFDPDFTQAQGWPVLGLDLMMMGVLGLVAVVGVKAVGVLLVPALLITPAAAARFWTDRLGRMLWLAAIFGAASGALGTLLSSGLLPEMIGFDPLAFGNNASLPTGPVIVLTGTAVFLFSMLFAPRRGVLARVLEQLQVSQKINRENLLRTLYELSEPALPKTPSVQQQRLEEERSWTPKQARRLLRWAESEGYVELENGSGRLTQAGITKAAAITRTHRLWELFLIQGAQIASDHVDRDADAIEHFLPQEVVDDLEAALAAQGRLPYLPGDVPQSPHELTAHLDTGSNRARKEPGDG